MRAKLALVLHLGGIGEYGSLIWVWSVQAQESGDLHQEMYQKDPWVAVNGSLNKEPRKKTWESFLDCIELHKLTILLL